VCLLVAAIVFTQFGPFGANSITQTRRDKLSLRSLSCVTSTRGGQHLPEAHQGVKETLRYPRRFLVACHSVAIRGGLLRFDRLATVLRRWGHEMAITVLADSPEAQRLSAMPVLSLAEAAAMRWDAVMIPGAPFSEETIKRCEVFREKRFGVRVQHVLNDQTLRAKFKKVNDIFSPHIVIFNNLAWPAGSFTEFQAERFHVLLGAVDVRRFQPAVSRRQRRKTWIVGGLANKNPQPLVEALLDLPPHVVLRLFGLDNHCLGETQEALVRSGRLELTDVLDDEELRGFYHDVDCAVSTEVFAGWSNLAAEAMASGVPVICTRHGTAAFARHEDTVLILDTPDRRAIATSIRRLLDDSHLCKRLADRGRKTISGYSWENYAEQLLALVHPDNDRCGTPIESSILVRDYRVPMGPRALHAEA
jgi:glycosyltransferase involved in cell wall biosynthesis